MLKAAIVGCGGISYAHRSALEKLSNNGVPVRITALCDIDESKLSSKEIEINIDTGGAGDMTDVACYTDMELMLDTEELDYVIICTPSFLHVEMSLTALKRGVNVLCEKPMALSYDKALEVKEAALLSDKHFMIAHCLRFSPVYQFLKACIEDNRYGNVISADFYRLSNAPTWGWKNWFFENALSGGCIFDLHIHDVDMVRYLFGDPAAVSALGRSIRTTDGYDTVNTRFDYNGALITVSGDWSLNKNYGFHQGYRVNFERANIIFSDNTITVNPDEGQPFEVDIGKESPYYYENELFINLILGRQKNNICLAEDSAKTIRLLECIVSSVGSNGDWIEFR